MTFKEYENYIQNRIKIVNLLINSFSIFSTFVFKFKKLLKTLDIPKMQISGVNLFFYILKVQYCKNTKKVFLILTSFYFKFTILLQIMVEVGFLDPFTFKQSLAQSSRKCLFP